MSITIVPKKRVKPHLRIKRMLQRTSAKQVKIIALKLGVPFAATDDRAREVIARRERLGWRRRSEIRGTEGLSQTGTSPTFRKTPFAPFRIWRANQSLSEAA